MNQKLHSKCPKCYSYETAHCCFNSEYVFLRIKISYITITWKCNNCSHIFEDVYRCEYLTSQSIISDNEKYRRIFLGEGEECPQCESQNLLRDIDGICYDLENRGGVHYQSECQDCKHVFDTSYNCQYVKNRSARRHKDIISDIIDLYPPPCATICPSCWSNYSKPRGMGIHIDTKEQFGVHLTIECLRCGIIYEDLDKCIYIGTRKQKLATNTDFYGRYNYEPSLDQCINCGFVLTYEPDDFCPFCNCQDFYPHD